MSRISRWSVVILVAAAGATVARAQCQWDSSFGLPGAEIHEGLYEPVVNAALEGGAFAPGVFIGGLFAQLGGIDARAIGAWNGESFTGLASGLEVTGPARFENPPYVNDMGIYDDGRGERLYVVGNFNTADPEGAQVQADQIASWNGESWSDVAGGLGPVSSFGAGPQPHALEVFGGELYAGGFLRRDLGSPVDSIGRYDGGAWRSVGGAFLHPVLEIGRVYVLAVFDDGSGESLYAAGEFTEAPGGVPARGIARWDGSSWSALGDGVDGEIKAMAVYDDGSGAALYVGGAFEVAGGAPAANIARWDGSSWRAVGEGIVRMDPGTTTGGVFSLTVFDDGAGRALYVGGQFTAAGGQSASHLAKWDGAWTPVPGAIAAASPLSWMHPMVRAMTATEVGSGGLIIGGFFDAVGDGVRAASIARLICDDCYADCDASGNLDFFDFLCFQNQFAAGDPAADCDASSALDFFDFLCFQNHFAAGCP